MANKKSTTPTSISTAATSTAPRRNTVRTTQPNFHIVLYDEPGTEAHDAALAAVREVDPAARPCQHPEDSHNEFEFKNPEDGTVSSVGRTCLAARGDVADYAHIHNIQVDEIPEEEAA